MHDVIWMLPACLVTFALAMVTCRLIERMWDQASYFAYLWRHRKFLKF
jgi:hypothetical protein